MKKVFSTVIRKVNDDDNDYYQTYKKKYLHIILYYMIVTLLSKCQIDNLGASDFSSIRKS